MEYFRHYDFLRFRVTSSSLFVNKWLLRLHFIPAFLIAQYISFYISSSLINLRNINLSDLHEQ